MIDLFLPFNCLRGKTICGIYALEINGHKYVGSAINIKKRLRQHRHALRNNKHDNKYLQNLYNKYKYVTYSIVKVLDTKVSNYTLRFVEKLYIGWELADVNFDDPIKGIGGTTQKVVYQYSLSGNFIKKWKSPIIASAVLEISAQNICQNANIKCKASKSYKGFIWSYIKKKPTNYTNNTGSNLKKTLVHVYKLNGNYIKSYNSLSDFARVLAKELKYQYHWSNLRSHICYSMQNPKTRTLRQKYKVSYKKVKNIKNL